MDINATNSLLKYAFRGQRSI